MADNFKLSVLTPRKRVFEGEVTTFTAPGFSGDFGVLPGHVAYITAVTPGALIISSKEGRSVWAVGAGFAQISAEKVSLIVAEATEAEKVDAGQARQDLSDAEEVLMHATPGEDDYNSATARQALALGRLAAMDRVNS
jgi:F-type H+-transporting ATPase subunit epsilon